VLGIAGLLAPGDLDMLDVPKLREETCRVAPQGQRGSLFGLPWNNTAYVQKNAGLQVQSMGKVGIGSEEVQRNPFLGFYRLF